MRIFVCFGDLDILIGGRDSIMLMFMIVIYVGFDMCGLVVVLNVIVGYKFLSYRVEDVV